MIRNDDSTHNSHTGALMPAPHSPATVLLPAGPLLNGHGASDAMPNLDGYRHALRRNWFWCVLLGVILGSIAAAGVWMFVPDRYTAFAELRAYSTPEQLLSGQGRSTEKYETVMSNLQQLLQSYNTLNSALSQESISALPLVRKEVDPVNWLAKRLSVRNPRNSEILRVSLTLSDPVQAQQIVDAIMRSFKEQVQDEEDKARKEKVDKLEEYYRRQLEEERQKRQVFVRLVEDAGSGDRDNLSLKQQIELQQASQLKTEWVRANIQRMKAEADVEALRSRLAGLDKSEVPADELQVMLAANPFARELVDERDTLKWGTDQVHSRMAGSGDHMVLYRVRQRMDEINERLSRIEEEERLKWRVQQRKLLELAIDEKESESKVYTALEADLARQVDGSMAAAEKIGRQSVDVEVTRTEIERLNRVVESVARELQVARLEQSGRPRIEWTTESAVRPQLPNQPRKEVLAGMAGLATFLLPGLGIILWDVRCQRVNSAKEIPERLGLPVFGSVPILPSRIARRLGSSSRQGRWWQAVLSEAIAGLRANLLRLEDVRVVMVTSSVGGEGKTTVATQLAMSLARAGKKTVLVDSDFPRPAVHAVFDIPLEPGLCDALRGEADAAELVDQSILPNLSVLPAGIADAHSGRAMNSSILPAVIEHLRDQFDYVIVDSSPLLPVADARVISRYVDGAICCVLRDVSRLSLVRKASELLDTFNVRLLGTVVTDKQDTYYLSYGVSSEERATVSAN